MKLINYYAWLLPIWLIASFCSCIASFVNFLNGKLLLGMIFLILSVALAFVSGILLQKAIDIYYHNKEVEWLEEMVDELTIKDEPFEEFNND